LNKRILLWSITAALAGFLFGFDTVVISGAEQTIQAVWHLSPTLHGAAIASALYGTVVGALIGGYLSDRLGRRVTLLLIGVLYLVGALWSALATDVYSFVIARVIGGVGIGVSTVAAPLYISEISPPKYRGRLAGMFQFNIVFGILVAYLSNALLAGTGENAWRWMLGVAALPSLIYTLLALSLPESPRWLLARRNDAASARAVLTRIDPNADQAAIEADIRDIVSGISAADGANGFWTWRLRRPIMLALMIAAFNQLSGINAILYFAPRIFKLAGLVSEAALLQSIGIGITNLIFTFVGLWLIDRAGRRTLLFIGSLGYIASLLFVSWSFYTAHYTLVPAGIFAFIAAHAIGQGAVIWVFIAEIFPNRQRAAGQALGSSTHWIFAALITTVFPAFVTAFSPSTVFLFFAFMMTLQLIWTKMLVIETKGVPLEQIQSHWN
jgi:SP family arabinose:H+ symporter-like MFS transporter